PRQGRIQEHSDEIRCGLWRTKHAGRWRWFSASTHSPPTCRPSVIVGAKPMVASR
ncbi:Os06g0720301, partial [Oryza sativa Japonica Group]